MKKILIALCAIAAFAVSASAQMAVTDDMKPRAKAVPGETVNAGTFVEDEVASRQEELLSVESFRKDSILVSEFDYFNIAHPMSVCKEVEGMIERHTPVANLLTSFGIVFFVLTCLTFIFLLAFVLTTCCDALKRRKCVCGCCSSKVRVKGGGGGDGSRPFREMVGDYLLPFKGDSSDLGSFVSDAKGVGVMRFDEPLSEDALDRVVGLLNGKRSDRFPEGTFVRVRRDRMLVGDMFLFIEQRYDADLRALPSEDTILFLMNRLQENWNPCIEDYGPEFVDPGDALEHVDDYLEKE